MDFYGITMKGPFNLEILATLPAWGATDEGRIVYDQSTKTVYYGTNTGWEVTGGSGDVSGEDILYQTLFSTVSFSELSYDKFINGTSVTASGSPTPTFDIDTNSWEGQSGSIVTTGELIQLAGTYYKFAVHKEATSGYDFIVKYSINGGGAWITLTEDTVITITGGFTSLMLQFTWNDTGTGNLNSFGMFYDEEATGFTTNSRLYETSELIAPQVAPWTLTIPNGGVYTKDGKSLHVFMNGVRLYESEQYTELTSTQITVLINGIIGDKFILEEQWGYVDTSITNATRLDREHDIDGYHTDITPDTVNGVIVTGTAGKTIDIKANVTFTKGLIVSANDGELEFLAASKKLTVLDSCTVGGEAANPTLPAFLVTASTQSDVTGDATTYTIQYATEVFDQANNFAANVFTAPVTRRYQLNAILLLNNLTSNHRHISFYLTTSNRSYGSIHTKGVGVTAAYWTENIAVLADMDVGDTAYTQISVDNDTKTVDIQAALTNFSGFLVC